MSELVDNETPVEETLEVEVVPELPELIHEYQPTDDVGRPIGGKQVLKYRTTDELISKIQEQNVLLTRKLREVTRKNRLGIVEKDTIAEDVQRFQSPVDFTPRDLSPEELTKLSRDMLDPERFAEAKDSLFEAQVGVKPEVFRSTVKDLQEEVMKLKAKQAVDTFLMNNPNYYRCQENFEAITNWMMKNNLDPQPSNFQLAHDTLKEAGVIIESGAPTEVKSVVTPIVPVAHVDSPEEEPVAPVKTVVPLGSGLTKSKAGDQGPPKSIGDDIVYEFVHPYTKEKRIYKGLAAINVMPAEEFKRRVNSDPAFSKKVGKLEDEAARKSSRPGDPDLQ